MRISGFLKTTLFLLLLLTAGNTYAAYLRDIPRELKQPNGDILHCFITGDEFYHRLHDQNNYTIIQNPETGYYVYAREVNGNIVPTGLIAGKTNPLQNGLKAGVSISSAEWTTQRKQMQQKIKKAPSRALAKEKNKGTIENLVICIQFSDDTPMDGTYSDLDLMLNGKKNNDNSMYNFFRTISGGQLTIQSHFYPAPVGNTLSTYIDSHPRNYYAQYSASNKIGYSSENQRTIREHALLKNAVDYVSASIPKSLQLDYDNDGNVDNVCFIVKGKTGDWSSLLWPHRWVLYTQEAKINGLNVWDYNFQLEDPSYFNNGTMSHEMFHTLGAPDLYHYDKNVGDFSSVGIWDVMDNTGHPAPQKASAYIRYLYGNWIEEIPEILTPGTYEIQTQNSGDKGNTCYKIATQDPNQYIVVEYRDNSEFFDQGLPGSGLLFYRINKLFEGNGNSDYNGQDILDEIYVYRPTSPKNEYLNINKAYFSPAEGSTVFNKTSNPEPQLLDGSPIGISVSDIRQVNDHTIQFTFEDTRSPYTEPEKKSVFLGVEAENSETVKIKSNTHWQIKNIPSWLSVTPENGTNGAAITIKTLNGNSLPVERSAYLLITGVGAKDQEILVTQAGTIPGCEWAVNLLPSDEFARYPFTGHSQYGISEFVEKFHTATPATIGSVLIYFDNYRSSTPTTSHITLKVYDEESGKPGKVLAEQNVYYNRIDQKAFNELQLETPAEVNGSYFVGYQIYYEGNDSIFSGVFSGDPSRTAENSQYATAWVKWNEEWISMLDLTGFNFSMLIQSRCCPIIPDYLGVDSSPVLLSREKESTVTINIMSNTSWYITGLPEWLEATPTQGKNDQTVTLRSLTQNPEDAERSCVLTIKGSNVPDTKITVTQSTLSSLSQSFLPGISLFPNPATDCATLTLPGNTKANIRINDTSGRIMCNEIVGSDSFLIRTAEWSAGIYLVTVDMNGQTMRYKLIVK